MNRAPNRLAALVAACILVGACSGCATQGPPPSPAARAVVILQDANTIYAQTLIAAGEAADRGVISEEQLAQVAAAGEVAFKALTTARAALMVYISTQSVAGDPSNLNATVEAVSKAITALVSIAQKNGV